MRKMGDRRQTMLLRAAKKIWKRGSIISRLSDLVEEHLSYLWIYFGGLEDVWNFRNWIFPKKSSKKGSLHKYPPLFSRCRDMWNFEIKVTEIQSPETKSRISPWILEISTDRKIFFCSWDHEESENQKFFAFLGSLRV